MNVLQGLSRADAPSTQQPWFSQKLCCTQTHSCTDQPRLTQVPCPASSPSCSCWVGCFATLSLSWLHWRAGLVPTFSGSRTSILVSKSNTSLLGTLRFISPMPCLCVEGLRSRNSSGRGGRRNTPTAVKYIYIYVCTCIYIYICIYIWLCIYVHI